MTTVLLSGCFEYVLDERKASKMKIQFHNNTHPCVRQFCNLFLNNSDMNHARQNACCETNYLGVAAHEICLADKPESSETYKLACAPIEHSDQSAAPRSRVKHSTTEPLRSLSVCGLEQ